LEARADERAAAEQAEYEAKLAQRAERERTTGRRPGGRYQPTGAGARDGDQYNFTDPESRNHEEARRIAGFEQDYNAQVAVDQASLLIVGWGPLNHPNDSQEAEPTLAAISIGDRHARGSGARCWLLWPCEHFRRVPSAASSRISPRAVIPITPVGSRRFAPLQGPPVSDASAQSRWPTSSGLRWQSNLRARKCTVEPVIEIIKEVLGFRQFSLRGQRRRLVSGGLVCLAFNLKRFHTLSWT